MLRITSGHKGLQETEPTVSRITGIKKPASANIYMFLVLPHKSLHGSFFFAWGSVHIFSSALYLLLLLLLCVIVTFLAADIALLNIVVASVCLVRLVLAMVIGGFGCAVAADVVGGLFQCCCWHGCCCYCFRHSISDCCELLLPAWRGPQSPPPHYGNRRRQEHLLHQWLPLRPLVAGHIPEGTCHQSCGYLWYAYNSCAIPVSFNYQNWRTPIRLKLAYANSTIRLLISLKATQKIRPLRK